MLRVLGFVLIVTALAVAVATFADQPGALSIDWLGWRLETSVFAGALGLVGTLAAIAALIWLIFYLIGRPGAIARFFRRRRDRRGLDALSRGLIAVGAGDREQAVRYAALARRTMPHAPMTALLRAQAAQLGDDHATARRIYQAMTERSDTELLGLHGLFIEATREQEMEAARQYAERAMRAKPALAWSVEALFDLQCRASDWEGALETLRVARSNGHVSRADAERRRAVLLTARAIDLESADIDRARELAIEASKLAPSLVPAAELAGRLLAAKQQYRKAARLIARAWRLTPHPDLAQAYAFLRTGDAPRDRLKRARTLAQGVPGHVEAAMAVANAAIDAKDWEAARAALADHLSNPTARVCTLMARIEAGEHGDQGRVREWLARALTAPLDPAWTADGAVSERWRPTSPLTGRLDAFEWKVPEGARGRERAALARLVAAALPQPSRITSDAPSPQAEGEQLQVRDAEPRREPELPAAAEKPRVRVKAGAQAASERATAQIYIPPRAPDDPGPPDEELEPQRG